jgi:antitoxin PrlF
MSGPAPWEDSPRRRASTRARLRPKSQLTLPEEVRRALHVREGDEIEFTVHEDGTITVRGYVSIPADHVRRYLPPQVPEDT